MYLTGDVTEGMSNRPGHIYELCQPGGLGYKQQYETADKRLDMFKGDIYAVDGNHDRWFQKSCGAIIVEDLCSGKEHRHFLGQDEGEHIVNGVIIRLFHGEDSSSYATSYRIQKLVEAMTGGEKPHVLLVGHTHKMGYFYERNIHCISGGTMQRQTQWMRGKRIAAHCGFWIVKLVIKDGEVKSCSPTFYPFYK